MKKTLIAVGILAVAGAVGVWFYGRPAYHQYKERRSLAQARLFLSRGDFRNASLSARLAWQLNPRNVEACRIIAELAERSRSPYLLDWRRRIAELSPTPENKLALASAALRIQGPPYPLAAQLLDQLSASATNLPAYHVIAAELALKLGKLPEAENHFQQASLIEPTNQLHQLNLAVLRLQSTNETVAAQARAALEDLRGSTNLAAVALRWLIAYRVQKHDLSGAKTFSLELLADSHATLDDRLQHSAILRQANDPQFEPYLVSVQKDAATNAVELYAVSSWMAGQGLAERALAWLTNLPPKICAEQPAPVAIADCYMATKQWSALETFLQSAKWAELDFLRLAFLSRAAAEQKQPLAADMHWRSAVREAGQRFGPLTTLLNLAASWGRPKAREELLWQIAQHFPRERWACLELNRIYQTNGNTLGLNKVSAMLISYNPKDYAAENNLATTYLLLKLNLPKAHELAKDIYQQHPEEPIFATTYAWSLHVQGRTTDALSILNKLKPDQLEDPPVALYYGTLLVATGNTNRAEKYLEIAKGRAASFLPEERVLMGLNPEPPTANQ